jgi:hypothetical protein
LKSSKKNNKKIKNEEVDVVKKEIKTESPNSDNVDVNTTIQMEEKIADGYHNPNDIAMMEKLRKTNNDASEEISNLAKENQDLRTTITNKETLLGKAAEKIQDYLSEIDKLKQEVQKLESGQQNDVVLKELESAREYGNSVRKKAEEEARETAEKIVSDANAEAEKITSKANKEVEIAEKRVEKANQTFINITGQLSVYKTSIEGILSEVKNIPETNKDAVKTVINKGATKNDPVTKAEKKSSETATVLPDAWKNITANNGEAVAKDIPSVKKDAKAKSVIEPSENEVKLEKLLNNTAEANKSTK